GGRQRPAGLQVGARPGVPLAGSGVTAGDPAATLRRGAGRWDAAGAGGCRPRCRDATMARPRSDGGVMPEPTRYEPPAYNPTVPNVARMYDYYLGGKNNFAADRAAAEKALAVAPELRVGAAEVRRFLARAVRYVAGRGIRQFVDI